MTGRRTVAGGAVLVALAAPPALASGPPVTPDAGAGAHVAGSPAAIPQQTRGGRIAVAEDLWAVTQPEADAVLLYDARASPPRLLDVLTAEGARGGEFRGPSGVAFDLSRWRLYVGDAGNDRVQVFELRPGPDGRPASLRFAKAVGRRGSAPGELDDPAGLAVAADGRLLVCDRGNARIQVFDASMQPTAVWGAGALAGPLDVVLDPQSGDGVFAWVIDAPSARVVGFDAAGHPVRSWGDRVSDPGALPDVPGLLGPFGITVGRDGTLFVSDVSRHVVQRFDREGRRLGWWGGYGTDDGRLFAPTGVAWSRDRVLLVDRRSALVQAAGADGPPHRVLTLDAAAPIVPPPSGR